MINFCRYANLRVPIGHCLKSIRGKGITTSTCLRAKDFEEVPVATYAQHKNSTQRTVLSVDKSKSSPSHVSTKDIQRTATPFDKTVVSRMTPTLRAFLLEGKVAVVTGYVLLMIHACISSRFLYSALPQKVVLVWTMVDMQKDSRRLSSGICDFLLPVVLKP